VLEGSLLILEFPIGSEATSFLLNADADVDPLDDDIGGE
jgi:hypothetical protein